MLSTMFQTPMKALAAVVVLWILLSDAYHFLIAKPINTGLEIFTEKTSWPGYFCYSIIPHWAIRFLLEMIAYQDYLWKISQSNLVSSIIIEWTSSCFNPFSFE
jgi:hypothetical protein